MLLPLLLIFRQPAAVPYSLQFKRQAAIPLCCLLCCVAAADRVDLSNCELSQLPPELFELTNLVELSLAGNQLTQLPAEIGRLSSLQRLVLAGNWLERLPQVMPRAGSSVFSCNEQLRSSRV
jgi:hypothetical protein